MKLVRDKIPEIIERDNKIPKFYCLIEDEDYIKFLKDKLFEEVAELLHAETKEQKLEELADVLEVMKALAKLDNLTIEDVIKAADEKAEERGAFDKRIYLISVTEKNEED